MVAALIPMFVIELSLKLSPMPLSEQRKSIEAQSRTKLVRRDPPGHGIRQPSADRSHL